MNIKHFLQIKPDSFSQLKNGELRYIVRVGFPQIKKIQRGDIISFENNGENEFDVIRVRTYDSFSSMFETERVSEIMPGATTEEAILAFRQEFPPYKEALGIYVIELRLKNIHSDLPEFIFLSELLETGRTNDFSRALAESYGITDWLCEDYPKHCELFFTKYVPGIFSHEREIISCYVDSKIVGTVFLKDSDSEKKICTFFARREFKKMGIESFLMNKSLEWLGTTRPLISIPDNRLPEFSEFIERFGWVETQTLKKGYYNDRSIEHVFNGKISKSCQTRPRK